jgi:hypothetical protein
MRKVCAWCKRDMGTVPSVNNSDGIISHGICEECVDGIFAQKGLGLFPLVDNFGESVVVLDSGKKARRTVTPKQVWKSGYSLD